MANHSFQSKFLKYAAWLSGLVVLAVCLKQSSYKGFEADMSSFAAWAMRLAEKPWREFYVPFDYSDYQPVYLYPLWLTGLLQQLLQLPWGTGAAHTLFKLPGILGQVCLAVLLVKYLQKRPLSQQAPGISHPFDLCLAWIFVCLNPALIHNVAVWGQIDSLFVLIEIVLILALFSGKIAVAGFLQVLIFFFKPQGIFLAPLWAYYFLLRPSRAHFKSVGLGALTGFTLVFFMYLPFWAHDPMQAPLHLAEMFKKYAYASLNAANFWAFLGLNFHSVEEKIIGPFTIFQVATFLVAISVLGFGGLLWKLERSANFKSSKIDSKQSDELLLITGTLGALAIYLFAPKMHERYITMLLGFWIVLMRYHRIHLFGLIILSLVAFSDQAMILDQVYVVKTQSYGNDVFFTFSFLFKVVVALLLIGRALQIGGFLKKFKGPDVPDMITGLRRSLQAIPAPTWNRKDVLALYLLTLAALLLNFFDLGAQKVPSTALTVSKKFSVSTAKPARAVWIYSGFGNGKVEVFCAEKSLASHDFGTFLEWKYLSFKEPCAGPVFAVTLQDKSQLREVIVEADRNEILKIESYCEFDSSGTCVPSGAVSPLFDEWNAEDDIPTYRVGTYFDEIYYARTGHEMIHKKPLYEETHPPLGKVWIALAMATIGEVPFGWRFVGALIGSFFPVLFFLLALQLFGRKDVAWCAAFLTLLDPARISLSRIATIDVQTCFWLFSALLIGVLLLKEGAKPASSRTFLSRRELTYLISFATILGLAAATKWVAIYALLTAALMLLCFIFFKCDVSNLDELISDAGKRRRFLLLNASILCLFGVLILGIYAGTYAAVAVWMKRPWSFLWENQVHMLRYHAELTAQHPFGSRGQSWPYMDRPVWFWMQDGLSGSQHSASIVMLGHPLFWWSALPAVVFVLYQRLGRYTAANALLVLAFFVQLLPWYFVSRITFLYHYFPSASIAMFLVAPLAMDSLKTRRSRLIAGTLFASVFLVYFPIITGLEVPKVWSQSLRLFDNWVF